MPGGCSHLVYLIPGIVFVFAALAVPVSAWPEWKEETKWKTMKSGRNDHTRRGPHLLPGLPTNVSVTTGGLVTLPCRLANLKGRSVSWIRKGDLKVLTTDNIVFTSDTRFKVLAWRTGIIWAWDLEIHDVGVSDAGSYECQINTRPKISHQLVLSVHQGSTVISGPSEVYLEAGSRLLLTCHVTAPPLPSGPVVWLHGDLSIDMQSERGGVSLYESQDGLAASSVLELSSVSSGDSGNYTCRPVGLPPATVVVYVLQDEVPRAMHHDSSQSLRAQEIQTLLTIAILIFSLR
ncbi:protein CEPU-1-like [Palaemon carinicauda]|uniref:protein CEPU-1-like n=1 Tax=Palaemon carinicauda TaxID=392227 RepID=UPI0035B5771C